MVQRVSSLDSKSSTTSDDGGRLLSLVSCAATEYMRALRYLRENDGFGFATAVISTTKALTPAQLLLCRYESLLADAVRNTAALALPPGESICSVLCNECARLVDAVQNGFFTLKCLEGPSAKPTTDNGQPSERSRIDWRLTEKALAELFPLLRPPLLEIAFATIDEVLTLLSVVDKETFVAFPPYVAGKTDVPHTLIPTEYRTHAITKKKAAAHLRPGNPDSGVEWLNNCIADGTITCKQYSRQSFVFDLREFPSAAQASLRPKPLV